MLERIIARRTEPRRPQPQRNRAVLPRRTAIPPTSLSIARLKAFVEGADPPGLRRRVFLWLLPRAAETRLRCRWRSFRSDVFHLVPNNRAETSSPFLFEASLKVKWDCAHSHLPWHGSPLLLPNSLHRLKVPPRPYTLSAYVGARRRVGSPSRRYKSRRLTKILQRGEKVSPGTVIQTAPGLVPVRDGGAQCPTSYRRRPRPWRSTPSKRWGRTR
jgi:hypothetical protein